MPHVLNYLRLLLSIFYIHKLFLVMQKGKNGFNQFAAG